MIIGDKKKAVGIILAKKYGDGSESMVKAPAESDMGDSNRQAKRAVAEDLLHAIESKSVNGITDALEALCDLIGSYDEEQDKEMMG